MDEIDMLRTEIESSERFKTVFQGFDKKQVTETVSQLMTENTQLTEQLEKYRAENVNLKKQLRDLQRERAEQAKQQNAAPAVDTAAIKAELEARYRAQVEELANRLREAQSELKAAQTEARNAQSELKSAQAEARNAQAEARNAQAEAKAAQQAAATAATNSRTEDLFEAEPVSMRDFGAQDTGNAMADLGTRFIVDDLKAQVSKLNEEKRKRGLRIAELEEMLQQEKDNAAGKLAMLTSLNDNMASILKEKVDELNEFATGWKDAFKATAI